MKGAVVSRKAPLKMSCLDRFLDRIESQEIGLKGQPKSILQRNLTIDPEMRKYKYGRYSLESRSVSLRISVIVQIMFMAVSQNRSSLCQTGVRFY